MLYDAVTLPDLKGSEPVKGIKSILYGSYFYKHVWKAESVLAAAQISHRCFQTFLTSRVRPPTKAESNPSIHLSNGMSEFLFKGQTVVLLHF